jgi:agmatine deiminase
MILNNTPLSEDFNFPFEGAPHLGTIILLPYRKDTWEDGGKKALPEFLNLVKGVSKYEHVYLIRDPHISLDSIKEFNMENVEIITLPYNDSWARDNTLIFLNKKDKVCAVDFGFNAWGGNVDGLYDDWFYDNHLGEKIANYLNIDYFSKKDFILEGGSIHTNGKGLLLTTEACLLSKGRNPNLTKEEIENNLKEYLGIKKVIWLPNGIVNDETNEHVDNFACFLNEDTVLLAWTDDKNDLQYEYSKKAYDILINSTTVDGKPLKVIKVMLPSPYLKLTKEEASSINQIEGAKPRIEGDRLAGSYINFYMGEKFIILPKFNVKEDIVAYNQFKELFKDKEIIQIESRNILVSGGNIHCVTMQICKGE